MASQKTSHIPSSIEVRPVFGNQHGIFARRPIRKGEPVAYFGGVFYNLAQLAHVPKEVENTAVQVDDDVYILPTEPGLAYKSNHSCEPNCGFEGQITLVALRDIAEGEHVAFDYAMCDSTPYDEFACLCGSARCRGQISGNDWKDKELQQRYKGYFSPYLQKKIDALPG